MKSVQMFGLEKIEVVFDGVTAGITITNNRSKVVSLFEVNEHRILKQCTKDTRPTTKALARSLSMYDNMRAKVFAL